MRVKLVYPSQIELQRAWNVIVKKEGAHEIGDTAPQWVEWAMSGKDVVERISRDVEDKGYKSGVLQDALAIAPLNITPNRLKDMVTNHRTSYMLAEAAFMSLNEVDRILWSSVVVSGVAKHPGGPEEGWKELWNRFSGTVFNSLPSTMYAIQTSSGSCYSVRVR